MEEWAHLRGSSRSPLVWGWLGRDRSLNCESSPSWSQALTCPHNRVKNRRKEGLLTYLKARHWGAAVAAHPESPRGRAKIGNQTPDRRLG